MSFTFVLLAFAIAYLHAAVALPIFWWLRCLGALRMEGVLVTSALVAAMPISLFTLSLDLPTFESVDNLVVVESGRLTAAGWLEIVWQSIEASLLGVSAGVVWYFMIGDDGRAHSRT